MIENTTTKITYRGDGETSRFPIPFVFFDASTVAVLRVDDDGARAQLARNVDFCIDQSDAANPAVALAAALPATSALTIYREQAATQSVSLVENARFPSAVIETGFDRIVVQQQIQGEALARALKAPVNEIPSQSETQLPPRASRLGRVLGWDAEGATTTYENPVQAIALATAAKTPPQTRALRRKQPPKARRSPQARRLQAQPPPPRRKQAREVAQLPPLPRKRMPPRAQPPPPRVRPKRQT